MKRRKLNRNLVLGHSFRIAMASMKMTFSDLASRAGVSINTCYRVVERTPKIVTEPLLKIGTALGFSEDDVRTQIRHESAAKGKSYSKKDRFYELLSEFVELFDSGNPKKERR